MTSATHPIRCRCGKLQGELSAPRRALRVTCYCRDCQTYAHAMGRAGEVLDAQGGTEIVAAVAPQVALRQGWEHLACLSLTERGIDRWYARCCGTPIANTGRQPGLPYVGLVHTALGDTREAVAASWPGHFAVNTESAHPPVTASRLQAVWGTARIMARVAWARLNGGWRRNPFFVPGTGAPVVTVQVLAPEKLAQARAAVGPARSAV